MARLRVVLLQCLVIAAAVGNLPAQQAKIDLWAVDALVKVFRDTPPDPASKRVEIRGGGNEYVSAQVAVRSDGQLRGLTARWDELRHGERRYSIPGRFLRWRFVGYIPIGHNSKAPEDLLVRKAPCLIPDPLLEDRQMDLAARQTQPIWLTVFIPPDAPAGSYRGRFWVGDGHTSAGIEVALEVYPFVLPEERHLWVTNWFDSGRIAKYHKVERWSDAHWELLGRYARNMASHRQNVVLTPLSLIEVVRQPDGKLTFDYSDFDRWVRLFEEAGACERIEISHVARHGRGGWGSNQIVFNSVGVLDRATGKRRAVSLGEILEPFLGNLERHLSDRGWLSKTMIHIADEPAAHNIESWRKISHLVHKAAPRIARIDAIEARDFGGCLEVWVPKLNYFPYWLRDFRAAQNAGNEMWFYTCCHPDGGHYPNRFLDYPTVATRVLHWINWCYRLEGYLHWGWNSWRDDPFKSPGPARLPPGDCFIVYPGKSGPLDSIRWEMMREGIQDFEEFHLLARKTERVIEQLGRPARAVDPRQRSDEICRRIVRSFTDYERDPGALREARRQLLDEIASVERPPLAVVATAPPAQTEMVVGPVVVEVYGVVEKGSTVKIAGRPVAVRSDGTFLGRVHLSPRSNTVEVVVEKAGRTKRFVRRFRIKG